MTAAAEATPRVRNAVMWSSALDEHAEIVAKAVASAGWVMQERTVGGEGPAEGAILRISRTDADAFGDAFIVLVGSDDDWIHQNRSLEQRLLARCQDAQRFSIAVLPFLLVDRPSRSPAGSTEYVRFDEELRSELHERYHGTDVRTVEELERAVVDALLELAAKLDREERRAPAAVDRTTPKPTMVGESFVDSWRVVAPDPLVLAWRLVVDLKATPDLLRNLDPMQLRTAVEKLESEIRAPGDRPWLDRIATAQQNLTERQSKQGSVAPSALWLAWARTVHASKVEALMQEPPTPAVSSPNVATTQKTGPSSTAGSAPLS